MGLLAKAKAYSSNNKGMGLLLVFFPEDKTAIADKTKLFSSPSSSAKSHGNSFRGTNSNLLLSKAQSTISICALLVFVTLLLFTLSTFEPTISTLPHNSHHRRFMLQKHPATHIPKSPTSTTESHNWISHLWRTKSHDSSKAEPFPSTALQRLGTLYRKGTRAMSDLVVGHVVEETSDEEVRLFLRVLHRSGLTAKADVVFIFASPSLSSRFAGIIQEENDSFLSLIHHYTELNSSRQNPGSNFDVTRFFKAFKNGTAIAEPLWAKKNRGNSSNTKTVQSELGNEITLLSYGSVLSFDATELDAENSLAGFLDRVPMSLRRWACYSMLLGRVRRNFKHVMLVDVKNFLVVGDPFTRVRNRSPESVFLYAKLESHNRQGKKNSDLTQSGRVNSGIIMGGARGVRRFSNAVLIEIVLAAMQRKKNLVSESLVLSQLVGNEFVLKNVNLIISGASIRESSSLGGENSDAAATSLSGYSIIQRGTSDHDFNSVIKKQICLSEVDSSVYKDC